MMRPNLRTALLLGLTILLMAWFLRQARLDQVWAEVRQARLSFLLVGLVLTRVAYRFRAVRWQYLLKPVGETRLKNAFRATLVGFAVSFVIPARAGEFVRPYMLARKERLSATAAFATVVLERLLDL